MLYDFSELPFEIILLILECVDIQTYLNLFKVYGFREACLYIKQQKMDILISQAPIVVRPHTNGYSEYKLLANGKRHGTYKRYIVQRDYNGKIVKRTLMEQVDYFMGKIYGKYIMYGDDKDIWKEINFVNNKRHGVSRRLLYDGTEIDKNYYLNNILVSKSKYQKFLEKQS